MPSFPSSLTLASKLRQSHATDTPRADVPSRHASCDRHRREAGQTLISERCSSTFRGASLSILYSTPTPHGNTANSTIAFRDAETTDRAPTSSCGVLGQVHLFMFAMGRLSEVLGVVSYIRVDDHGRPTLADGRCMKQAAKAFLHVSPGLEDSRSHTQPIPRSQECLRAVDKLKLRPSPAGRRVLELSFDRHSHSAV